MMNSTLYEAIKAGRIDYLNPIPFAEDNDLIIQMSLMKTHLNNNSLHVAVQYNQEVCVKMICKTCPSLLLQQNFEGNTPLHVAARLGLPDVAKVLLNFSRQEEEGGDVERGEESSNGCMTNVAGEENGCLKLQQLVRMENKNKDTALHEALRNRANVEVLKLLAEADPSFEYSANLAGETPLYLAVKYGEWHHVDYILDNFPCQNHRAPGGRTVLHIAVLYTFDSGLMVDVLLKKKPHMVKEVDRDGRSALHYAAFYGAVEVAIKLLDVDPTVAYIQDKDGMTALHHAAGGIYHPRSGHQSDIFIEHVIRRCPDCWELVDSEGRNFLHVAVEKNRSKVVKYVFDMKSNYMVNNLIHSRDKHGNTPWNLALESRANDVNFVCARECGRAFLNDPRVKSTLSYPYICEIATYDRLHYYPEETRWEQRKEVEERAHKRRDLGKLENLSQIHMVVAALIATVAFAAGFTVPGGYKSDGPNEGMATLAKKAAFIVFVVSNSLAMLVSVYAVFIHFWSKFQATVLSYKYELISVAVPTLACTFVAILAMSIAFVTGTYTVLSHIPRLAIPVCTLCCSFFFFIFSFMYQSYKMLDEADRGPFVHFVITKFNVLFHYRCSRN
ncbi:hypothetical protein MKX03_021983 [Papaver bracteatum]|nr:hypothetical protein MKX03_021983 [Papaver bracteatum]